MTDFKKILADALSEVNHCVSDKAADNLCIYYEMLIQQNRTMNLTALTEPRDVALKHFADCLSLLSCTEITENASVIDVGTGAGFPGLVLKIARPDIRLTLLDSLNKRLEFLRAVCERLGLEVELVHARAEDGSRAGNASHITSSLQPEKNASRVLREGFDYAVSRAVAPLNILAEYTLPYVKIGGQLIAMKGKDAQAELAQAQNAVTQLSGRVNAVHTFELAEAGSRAVICIDKIAPTDAKYPRTGKKIKSKPL